MDIVKATLQSLAGFPVEAKFISSPLRYWIFRPSVRLSDWRSS